MSRLPRGPVVLEFSFEVKLPYDFDATVRARRFGKLDPTARWTEGHFDKAFHTPDGPAAVSARSGRGRVRGEVYGEGGVWLLDRLTTMLGLHDEVPLPPPGTPGWLRARWREGMGVRLSRAPVLSEEHVTWILQQRVTYASAARSYRLLTERYGDTAPGPSGLKLPLTPRQWAAVPGHVALAAELDAQRYRNLQHAVRAAQLVNRAKSADELRAILMSLSGTKSWTTEFVMGFGFGDADALPLGDLHLPHQVARAFLGARAGTDDEMVATLETYRPNRFRVVRLVV